MSPAMLPEKLISNRLEMREVSVQWLEEIFAENKGNVGQYFVKFGAIGEAQTWINENRRQFERGEKMEMVLLNAETKEFVGMVSLQKLNIFPEFGIWIKEAAQGRGFGKEAVQSMLNWYKTTFGASERIRYLAESSNIASISLAKSLLMEPKGQVCNEEGLLFEEFHI